MTLRVTMTMKMVKVMEKMVKIYSEDFGEVGDNNGEDGEDDGEEDGEENGEEDGEEDGDTCITLIGRPVSFANVSRMCLVGFGVCKQTFRKLRLALNRSLWRPPIIFSAGSFFQLSCFT